MYLNRVASMLVLYRAISPKFFAKYHYTLLELGTGEGRLVKYETEATAPAIVCRDSGLDYVYVRHEFPF
jgi:hypothetical protein